MALRGRGRAGGSVHMEAFAPTVDAAFDVCVLASYAEVKALLATAERTSTAGLMLAATAWQCEGDALRAESTLRRAAEHARGDERAYVVDLLVPLLISRGVFTRAAGFLGGATSPRLGLGRVALQAVIDAANGAARRSEELAAEVRDALPRLDDDVVRMRVHQRLALAAYWRGDMTAALDDVAEGLRLAKLLDAHRFAVTLHSVAYAVHQASTGDAHAAWYHASALARDAELGGDASYRGWANVTLYELAAERGDDEAMARARAAIDAH